VGICIILSCVTSSKKNLSEREESLLLRMKCRKIVNCLSYGQGSFYTRQGEDCMIFYLGI
jgi:hypothetical protein